MLRRIGTLATAVLLAGAIVAVLPASPASANNTGVCVGQGSATTGPLYYPGYPLSPLPEIPPTPRTVAYAFDFQTGACVFVNPPGVEFAAGGAAGTVTGWCGHSTGTGTTTNGHSYSHVSAGSFLVLLPTGSVPGTAVGLVNAVPDVTAGQSCTTGATRFIVTGVVVLI